MYIGVRVTALWNKNLLLKAPSYGTTKSEKKNVSSNLENCWSAYYEMAKSDGMPFEKIKVSTYVCMLFLKLK